MCSFVSCCWGGTTPVTEEDSMIETVHTVHTPIQKIVPRAQIVRFEDEAAIADEFVMCTAPEQPRGFHRTANPQLQVLQVDIGAPCTIFMMRDNGNLIVVRPNSMSGVRVIRPLTVVAAGPDSSLEEASAVISGKPRKQSIAGRKTSVKGLMHNDFADIEEMGKKLQATNGHRASESEKKSPPGKQHGS